MVLKDVVVNARPGEPQFDVHTNRCDYFLLGTKQGADVWIEGAIVNGAQGPEYIFNGRLFCADGGQATIIDSFPKSDPPAGWSKHPRMDGPGFTLVDAKGETVFGYRVEGNVCTMELGLHKADGTVAAGPGQGGLFVNVTPAMIGRNGIAYR